MAQTYIQYASLLHHNPKDDLIKAKSKFLVLQDFEIAVRPLWALLTQDRHARASKSQVIDVFTRIMTLLVNVLDYKHRRLLAQEFVKMVSRNAYVTFHQFQTLFIELSFLWIENCDVRSTVSFIKMLTERISVRTAFNIVTQKQTRAKTNINLSFYQKEKVESSTIEQKERSGLYNHPIYYQQKVLVDQQFQIVSKDPNQVVSRKLQPLEEIVPLGYTSQCFWYYLRNQDFILHKKYQPLKKQGLKWHDLSFKVSIQLSTLERIRDKVSSNIVCRQYAVLKEGLKDFNPQQHDRMNEFYRLNGLIWNSLYFQQLKTEEGNLKYFNILSYYFQREEFHIDQKHEVKQKWNRKKISKKNQTVQAKVKKQPIDQDDFSKKLFFNLSKEASKLRDDRRLFQLLKFFQGKNQDSQNTHLDLSQYQSKYFSLPDQSNQIPELIQFSKSKPIQMLVVGKPLSGKSSFSQRISKRLDIIYIQLQSLLLKLFEKVKFYEQNPPETDAQGNPIEVFTKVQKCILQDLQAGNKVDLQDMLDLLNSELSLPQVINKGFILQLPIEYHNPQFDWLQKLLRNQIRLPRVGCSYFTHVVQFNYNKQEYTYFSNTIFERPEDLRRISAFQIQQNNRPKPTPVPDPDEDQPPAEQQPLPPIYPITLLRLFPAPDDVYQQNLRKLSPVLNLVSSRDYIKAKLHNPNRTVEVVLSNLYNDPRPLAKKLQASSQKQLLTVGLEEVKLCRKWSYFNTVDPVALAQSKLIMGKAQFAAEYAGYVFMFESQLNLNKFINSPRFYTKSKPSMPKRYNIAIVGPKKSGKKTLAHELSRIYGWKVVNVLKIVQEVIERQKAFVQHIPSNFQKRVNSVHLSQPEWKQFSKGQPLPSKQVVPILLKWLQCPLQKKPQDWGIEKVQNQEQKEQQKQKQDQKKKALSKSKAPKKKDKENKEEERPKTPPPEDLALKDIIHQINHLNKIPEVKGIILVGYPITVEQQAALKASNIIIDKYISLVDLSQQPANNILSKRLSAIELQQAQILKNSIGPVKQQLGEQIVREVSIDGSKDDLILRARRSFDPFIEKPDIDQHNRVCADVQEDDEPIQWGPTFNFCPVIARQGWLIKGKDEFEAGFKGRRYRFYNQENLNSFKKDPSVFQKVKPELIPPRIMFIGIRGIGLSTLFQKLHNKYKIPVLNLKENFLSHLDNLKSNRRAERYYNKGFKPKEYDQQKKQIPDPEIEDQSPDFDRKLNQVNGIKLVFDNINQVFINANFFDVEEDKVTTPLVQILVEAKKLPETIVFLKVSQGKWLQRVFNVKAVQLQHQKLIIQKKQARLKERQEMRLKGGEDYQQPPEDQGQLDMPKLEDMIAQRKEKLLQQHSSDLAKIQQMIDTFKGLNVETIVVQCQRQADKVFDKVVSQIDTVIVDREHKFIQNIVRKISINKVEPGISNFILRESNFGKRNPFTLLMPVNPLPITFKERVYYLDSEQQLKQVRRRPEELLKAVRNKDVRIVPIVFVIGEPKSGKTTLCDLINVNMGLVKISISELIQNYLKEYCFPSKNKVLHLLRQGADLPDQLIVQLLKERLAMVDCLERGCVIDDFPKTKRQSILLSQSSIVANCVFRTKLSRKDLLSKCGEDKDIGYKQKVMIARLNQSQKELFSIQNYYSKNYKNIRIIESTKAKWGMFVQSRNIILQNLQRKNKLAETVAKKEAGPAFSLGFSRQVILHNLSKFQNYCPVSLKIKREYISLDLNEHQHVALYDNKFYYLASQNQYSDFTKRPEIYAFQTVSINGVPHQPKLPQLLRMSEHIENKGYCIVQLYKKKLQACNPCLSLIYNQKLYGFSKVQHAQAFKRNPKLFSMARLPDKLPVEFTTKNQVKKIAKKGDCTAFLEHHLGNIIMRVLAQLGFKRLKYPTISSKQTALKFIAISLKMLNPNKDQRYRQKYREKMQLFIKHCSYAQQIKQQFNKRESKGKQWDVYQQQNLLKLTEQFGSFMQNINAVDKITHFSQFIR